MADPIEPINVAIDVIEKEGACAVNPNEAEARTEDTVTYHNQTTKPVVISFADSLIFGTSEIRLDPDQKENLIVNEVQEQIDYTYSCDYETAAQTELKTARPIIIVYPKES